MPIGQLGNQLAFFCAWDWPQDGGGGRFGRKANIQTHLIATTFLASHGARYKLGS